MSSSVRNGRPEDKAKTARAEALKKHFAAANAKPENTPSERLPVQVSVDRKHA
jgi:hypothetical protein